MRSWLIVGAAYIPRFTARSVSNCEGLRSHSRAEPLSSAHRHVAYVVDFIRSVKLVQVQDSSIPGDRGSFLDVGRDFILSDCNTLRRPLLSPRCRSLTRLCLVVHLQSLKIQDVHDLGGYCMKIRPLDAAKALA